MARIRVKLRFKGKTYRAEADTDSDPVSMAKSFAKDLNADPNSDYRIALFDTLSLQEGATIDLLQIPKEPRTRILEELDE